MAAVTLVIAQNRLAARAANAPPVSLSHSPATGKAPAAAGPYRTGSGSRSISVPASQVPAGLVAGACVDFNPTGHDLHRTVFVDAGHGGPDPGAVSGNVEEKALSLAVALKLRDMLRADGYHVVLSRTADTSVAKLAASQVQDGAVTISGVHLDTLARIACANSANADALVSIHFNAFDDPSAGGSEAYYDDVRSFAAANLRLATLVESSLLASFTRSGWTVFDRGVLSDAATGSVGLTAQADSYGRLMELGPGQAGWNDHPSAMPGVLVEPFFVTDPVEAQVASSDAGQVAIASGIEQGLVGFLTNPDPSPSATP